MYSLSYVYAWTTSYAMILAVLSVSLRLYAYCWMASWFSLTPKVVDGDGSKEDIVVPDRQKKRGRTTDEHIFDRE